MVWVHCPGTWAACRIKLTAGLMWACCRRCAVSLWSFPSLTDRPNQITSLSSVAHTHTCGTAFDGYRAHLNLQVYAQPLSKCTAASRAQESGPLHGPS
jgi:hypothetical protein